ncbi:hypothetical protein M5K25_013484 [Dendrobium thyrsiflorum]|uniref:Uncharacterized protein n=1 Tax=Dendrobium thyrsiflorum TaxID=117978 RepID=A0ABD0UT56_DENTH
MEDSSLIALSHSKSNGEYRPATTSACEALGELSPNRVIIIVLDLDPLQLSWQSRHLSAHNWWHRHFRCKERTSNLASIRTCLTLSSVRTRWGRAAVMAEPSFLQEGDPRQEEKKKKRREEGKEGRNSSSTTAGFSSDAEILPDFQVTLEFCTTPNDARVRSNSQ